MQAFSPFEESRIDFLMELADTPGPSGFEAPAVDRWLEEAGEFAEIRRDALGSGIATVNAGSKGKVSLVGHLDEIGLIVTKIDDKGLLRFASIGGWDVSVLVGQRVRVLTRKGVVHGVLVRNAIHLIDIELRKKAPKITDLWIDIAAENAEEAREMVRIGDPIVIDATPRRIGRNRLISRSLDNRVGAFICLEAARACIGEGQPEVNAVGCTYEENGGAGAAASAVGLAPDAAIVVDVTSTTTEPGTKSDHHVEMGKGPVITRGASTASWVAESLIEAAESAGLPYQLRGMGRTTSTDADSIYKAGSGVAAGLLSVPCRYLHSPCEQVDLRDVEATVGLIAAWVGALGAEFGDDPHRSPSAAAPSPRR
jgi:endoglucanase